MVPVVAVVFLSTLGMIMQQAESYYKHNLTEGERISNGQYLMVPENSSLVPPWLSMQRDCNFVLYDQFGRPAWNTVTQQQGIAGFCYATITRCNLLVYNGKGDKPADVLWNSSTTSTRNNVSGIAPCVATIKLTEDTHLPTAVLYDAASVLLWSSPPESPRHHSLQSRRVELLTVDLM